MKTETFEKNLELVNLTRTISLINNLISELEKEIETLDAWYSTNKHTMTDGQEVLNQTYRTIAHAKLGNLKIVKSQLNSDLGL